jgi:predicted dehydrogenase
LGTLLSAQARFHQLDPPHAAWMRDRAWAGGGALIDLGTPLLDLLLTLLDFPPAAVTAAHLWRAGGPPGAGVEDFATVLGTVGGAPLHCEVSWGARLPRTAVSVTLFGTVGTLVWHNAGGRLDTFTARLARPGAEETLAEGVYDPAAASLAAFAARCATPPWSASLAPYRAVAALVDQAYASHER